MPKIILETIEELSKWRNHHNDDINFVPTMGDLHSGHEKLIQSAKNSYFGSTLVSIFVNPLQFNNKEDLKSYPPKSIKDHEIAFQSGADVIFIPREEELLDKNCQDLNFIRASKELNSTLCGLNRIGHFDGVCTVVYRLLKLVQPQLLFLGEKDWQQLLIIKNMLKEMKLNIKIKSIPTQRDQDGIPYSSRNKLLKTKDREKLIFFSQKLNEAKNTFLKEDRLDLVELTKEIEGKNINIEYLKVVDAFSLKEAIPSEKISMLAGAIKCGNTRLIDHVFLMKTQPIIAIDGPAGSGKSTVTKVLAKKLKLLYLDTGAMYRALSWFLINENIDYSNNDQLKKSLKGLSIVFKTDVNSNQDILINDICVTKLIRTQEINSIVSKIASIPAVREFLVNEQRQIGASGGLVAEGRDIGTKVFPNATLKIYLTASIDERAKRRKLELEDNEYGSIELSIIKEQIKQRDQNDMNRSHSPLIKAKDAILIESDGLSVEKIVENIIDIYNEKIPQELQTE